MRLRTNRWPDGNGPGGAAARGSRAGPTQRADPKGRSTARPRLRRFHLGPVEQDSLSGNRRTGPTKRLRSLEARVGRSLRNRTGTARLPTLGRAGSEAARTAVNYARIRLGNVILEVGGVGLRNSRGRGPGDEPLADGHDLEGDSRSDRVRDSGPNVPVRNQNEGESDHQKDNPEDRPQGDRHAVRSAGAALTRTTTVVHRPVGTGGPGREVGAARAGRPQRKILPRLPSIQPPDLQASEYGRAHGDG